MSELREAELGEVTVERLPILGDEVEERYRWDADGVVAVDIVNLTSGYEGSFSLHGSTGAI